LHVASQSREVNFNPRRAQRKSCRIEIHPMLKLFNHESRQMKRKNAAHREGFLGVPVLQVEGLYGFIPKHRHS